MSLDGCCIIWGWPPLQYRHCDHHPANYSCYWFTGHRIFITPQIWMMIQFSVPPTSRPCCPNVGWYFNLSAGPSRHKDGFTAAAQPVNTAHWPRRGALFVNNILHIVTTIVTAFVKHLLFSASLKTNISSSLLCKNIFYLMKHRNCKILSCAATLYTDLFFFLFSTMSCQRTNSKIELIKIK